MLYRVLKDEKRTKIEASILRNQSVNARTALYDYLVNREIQKASSASVRLEISNIKYKNEVSI